MTLNTFSRAVRMPYINNGIEYPYFSFLGPPSTSLCKMAHRRKDDNFKLHLPTDSTRVVTGVKDENQPGENFK